MDDIPINTPTFNIAKIISDCPSLQRLVDLGVDLSRWEDNDTNGDTSHSSDRGRASSRGSRSKKRREDNDGGGGGGGEEQE